MRQASLIAGVGILLGALALVRPWGLRPPRWLIVIPALTGSAWAAAHALTAYLTNRCTCSASLSSTSAAGRSCDEGA